MGTLRSAVSFVKLALIKLTFNLLYQLFYRVVGPKPKRVVLASQRAGHLTENLARVHAYLVEFDVDLKVACYHFHRTLAGRVGLMLNSVYGLYLLATAKLFVVDDYYFPLYAVKKHKQNQVVQLWHAVGTLKRFGLALNDYKGKKPLIVPHSNYDWAVVNARQDKPAYEEAFGIDKKRVVALGMPFLDTLAKYPVHEPGGDKKLLIYAPTYRRGRDDKSAVSAFIAACADLGSEWEVEIYLHPYVNLPEKADLPANVALFQDSNRVKERLADATVFVTDYSSLSLQFAYFERPILLYVPDMQEYQASQGFFVDYLDYMGAPHFAAAKTLIKFVNTKLTGVDVSYVRRLKHLNGLDWDGKNTARVGAFLLGLVPNEVVKKRPRAVTAKTGSNEA